MTYRDQELVAVSIIGVLLLIMAAVAFAVVKQDNGPSNYQTCVTQGGRWSDDQQMCSGYTQPPKN